MKFLLKIWCGFIVGGFMMSLLYVRGTLILWGYSGDFTWSKTDRFIRTSLLISGISGVIAGGAHYRNQYTGVVLQNIDFNEMRKKLAFPPPPKPEDRDH